MNADIKGLELAEKFYHEIVEPLLKENYPNLSYACGLLGTGSEVLGFDDEISTDHHWGPRLQFLLNDDDYYNLDLELHDFFAENLPPEFMGYSTHWSPPDPEDSGTQLLQTHEGGKINHRIEILSIDYYLRTSLSISTLNLEFVDWLIIPEQKLLEFTSGKLFRDDLGELTKYREKLKFYPDDVLRFKLIGCWDYINQEAPFIGRTGGKGDDLGSRIITTRMVKMLIKIAYLLEKKYPPYSKWLTHGFDLLPNIEQLKILLERALTTSNWREREDCLCEAILILIEKQNKLSLTKPLSLKPEQFHGRDIKIIEIEIVVKALSGEIDLDSNSLSQIGGIDQFIDNTLILSSSSEARKIIGIYDDVFMKK
ncbi:MAG: DUF4037 domain-containing protein [Candidatus Hodarchaeales archaeon]